MKGGTEIQKDRSIIADERFREDALTKNTWELVLKMGLPLAFYEMLNSLYKILDSLMASHINASSVSTVAYLAQISILISAVGQGLSVGGGLKISEAYGAGDYTLVRRRVSSLFALSGLLALFVLLLIPAAPLILAGAGTPKELIAMGVPYFQIELVGLAVVFMNNTYIAIERARGNTKRIFHLNMIVTVLKLLLTAFFVYALNGTITMISVASIISQSVLLIIGIKNVISNQSAFRFSVKNIRMNKEILLPILLISFPVIVERIAFSAGKVIVNAMCGVYGALTVGALGISNTVTGIFANAQSGIQSGGAALISQNMGGKKTERVPDILKKIVLVNLMIGITGTILCYLGADTVSTIYASSSDGLDETFRQIVHGIFLYDSAGTIISWGISASVEAFLYGIGKTKMILFINVCRLFLFRIFFLWILQRYTSLGSECAGIVMMVSNNLTAVLSCILGAYELRVFCRKNEIG